MMIAPAISLTIILACTVFIVLVSRKRAWSERYYLLGGGALMLVLGAFVLGVDILLLKRINAIVTIGYSAFLAGLIATLAHAQRYE